MKPVKKQEKDPLTVKQARILAQIIADKVARNIKELQGETGHNVQLLAIGVQPVDIKAGAAAGWRIRVELKV
jgi:hypothetical protein